MFIVLIHSLVKLLKEFHIFPLPIYSLVFLGLEFSPRFWKSETILPADLLMLWEFLAHVSVGTIWSWMFEVSATFMQEGEIRFGSPAEGWEGLILGKAEDCYSSLCTIKYSVCLQLQWIAPLPVLSCIAYPATLMLMTHFINNSQKLIVDLPAF